MPNRAAPAKPPSRKSVRNLSDNPSSVGRRDDRKVGNPSRRRIVIANPVAEPVPVRVSVSCCRMLPGTFVQHEWQETR